MATPRVTVSFDLDGDCDSARAIVRAYNGKIEYDGSPSFIGARVHKARIPHLKSTATKKGLTVYVYN